MKKILLIAICLLMTACANSKLAIKELKPMEQTSFMITPQLVYPYKDGFFTCGQDNYLYYYEHLDKAVQISELSYRNDKPYSDATNEKLRYEDTLTGGYIVVYDEQLLYLSHYLNSDGEQHFNLISLSLDGKKRSIIMSFPYEPIAFTVHRGKVFTMETDENLVSTLHVYDENGKEVFTRKLAGASGRLFADGEWVYYSDVMASSNVTRRIHVDDLQESQVFEGDPVYFTNNGLFSRSHPSYENNAMSYTDNRIEDMEGNIVFQSDNNQVIQYFDDDRIYISNKSNDHIIYQVYDYDGNLVQTIDPADSAISSPWMDIYRIIDGQILTSIIAENGLGFMACNIEDGACRLLDNVYE